MYPTSGFGIDSGIYGVIDRSSCGIKPLAKVAKQCVQAGVRIIQLRDKTEDVNLFYRDALLIRKIVKDNSLFIVNDRADIAKLVQADGLHLGQCDLPIEAARKILGPNKIIGKSTHSLRQAILACEEGADYVSIGPIFKTATKPEYKPVGLRALKRVCQLFKIPVVAIGGIDEYNIRDVREAGARIVAVVRAICNAPDISKAVLELNASFSSSSDERGGFSK